MTAVRIKQTLRYTLRLQVAIILRFFFHERGPNHYTPDHRGLDLDDVQAARSLALETAWLMMNASYGTIDCRGWSFEIADRAGRTIFTLPFSEAVGEPASK